MVIDWLSCWRSSYLLDRRETYGLDSLYAVPVERKRIPYRQPPQQLHKGLRADFRHAIEEQDLPVGPLRVVESVNVKRFPIFVLKKS